MRARLIAACGLLGLATWSCPSPPRPAAGQDREVTVDVRCTGEEVVATVNPWSRSLDEGDAVVWLLVDPSQTIEIKKKQSAWPFSDNKFTGNRGDPPRGRGMKGGQKGKRFHYGIVVTCQGPSGPREVIIDPDMYVR